MKKTLHLAIFGLCAGIAWGTAMDADAQKVKAVWSLGNIDDLAAVAVSGDEAYVSQLSTSFAKGNQLTATTTMATSGADAGLTAVAYDPVFMRFQPAAQVSSKTSGHGLSYTLSPAVGHTFKPTSIAFDAAKVGTDGGVIDVYIQAANGSETAFQTGLSPLRNKITATNTAGYSSFVFPVSDYLLSGESFTVTVYMSGVGTTKEMAFRNLTLEGMVDEPIYDLSHYITAATCSAGDIYPYISALGNGETATFPDKLSADPTDFAVTAAEGYEAVVEYVGKVATIKVSESGNPVFSASIRFVVSSRNHGVAKPLNRGLHAISTTNGVLVSWRMRTVDGHNTTYNVYRDGELVSGSPFSTVTNVLDKNGTTASVYSLEVMRNGEVVERQENVGVWEKFYKHIPVQTPLDKRGLGCNYTPNDCSAYDMDGDGEYEIILKWDPDNSKDSAGSGVTGSVYMDCYKLDGTLLWRIDLGQNIRAGAHYTQFLCYDFDGDGFGEMVCKTAPGTVDGEGNYVLMGNDDPSKSYVNGNGHIISGPEYLTIFDGVTGGAIHTVKYEPAYGDVPTSIWGDSKANRSDRYKACVAFLDGEHPSAVMMRGYYSGSFAAAYDFDGQQLVKRWYHKSDQSGKGTWGEGAHSVTVGDVDGDGKDEVIVGSACIDDDGSTLWRGGTGHGDALHLGDFDLDNPGMEVFMVYEDKKCAYDATLRDAKTGRVLSSCKQTNSDTGRGLIFDIDSRYRGAEFMHSSSGNLYSCKGEVICPWQQGTVSSSSINYRIYWDGDLYDEYHDRQHIDKWDSQAQGYGRMVTLYNEGGASSINSTKHNPNLQADLFGDWREETIYWVTEADGTQALTIFTTPYTSNFAMPTLRDDHVYDMAIAWQNVGYNQPPHLSYSPINYFTIRKNQEEDCEWIPFYSSYKVDLPEGVEAYCVRGYSKAGVNDTVQLSKVETGYLPAGMPMLLKSPVKAATEHKFFPSDQIGAVSAPINYLRGIMWSEPIASDPEETAKGEFFYEFRKDPALGYGFFLISSDGQELPDHTAYLRIKETAAFKHAPYYLLGRPWNNGTSAIENIRTDVYTNDSEVYDLTGRRVEHPKNGFYIIGGKKVFIGR